MYQQGNKLEHNLQLKLKRIFVLIFQVSRERGEQLAVEYGIKFMETSAKASINVEEAFLTLASDIKAKMEKRMEANNPPKGGHQLKSNDHRKAESWLSRCSLL
ncbi:ras-related protein Rab-8A [Lucilia cuprina]|uniref:ras-related protein Rab-8A n=1 Tax=Lucilia cuprina TaxID=7375 RepID=UPI001F06A999|nr:ras-related protein Rab-8A [Lucilia cuprina]